MLPLLLLESMVFFDWLAMAKQAFGRIAINSWVKLMSLWLAIRGKRAMTFALSLLLAFAVSAPAQASIHTYPEPERQTTMYRSRLSLRDNQDLAWQIILFKRVKEGQVIELNLRLISFPGQFTLSHPQALLVEQGGNQVWELPDETLLDPQLQWSIDSLAQYDAKPLLMTLERSAPMTLTVTLDGQEQREVLVPPYVVKEWLQLQEMPLG